MKTLTQEKLFESMRIRFWENVLKQPGDNCWKWLGHFNGGKYPGLWYKGRVHGAHRLSWMIHCGDISDGLMVLHDCDNPECTNPSHLFLGTNQDNIDDKVKKGRQPRQKGEEHGQSRLTEEAVLIIRKEYVPGRANHPGNGIELAQRFGVCVGTIRSVAKRLVWTHVLD